MGQEALLALGASASIAAVVATAVWVWRRNGVRGSRRVSSLEAILWAAGAHGRSG